MGRTWTGLWPMLALLCGCSAPMRVQSFAAPGPQFDPVRFFTGHTRSWGVLENRSGAPTGRVETDCHGEAEGPDGLHMVQLLKMADGTVRTRDWRMRRTGPHSYQATANDMVGTATGEAAGRVFHWRWVLATDPGNPLKNVALEQWMYLMEDGAMVNRTVISKLGITLAEVTEQFEHSP